MSIPKPIYKHDCKKCIFLGYYIETIPIGEGQVTIFDLYFCPQSGIPTVIARYGNEPEANISGLWAAENTPSLAEAKRISIKTGLLKEEKK